MSAGKRPPATFTLHELTRPLVDEPAPEVLEEDDPDDGAADIAQPKKKLPPHRSGSLRHPYPSRRGNLAKLNVTVTVELFQEYREFAVTYLPPGQKGAWTERVLRAAMARERRRREQK